MRKTFSVISINDVKSIRQVDAGVVHECIHTAACVYTYVHIRTYILHAYFHIFTYTCDGFFPPVGRVTGRRNEKAYVIASIGKLFKANNAQTRNYTSSTNGAATAGIKSWCQAALWCQIIDEIHGICSC